jgi:hypothetical protein
MAENNQAGDMYNPPSNLSHDFEEYYFGDLEVDELFWETNDPNDKRYQNTAWRKVSQTEGRNLKTQKIYSFDRKTKVFQKI